jgi:TRAP-type C4-dicarboxylate transport system permease small subunit
MSDQQLSETPIQGDAMEKLSTCVELVERCASYLATTIMALIMGIVTVDVGMRYALNRPLIWAYDVISLYLMAALFYFAVSDAYQAKSLVNIDMLYERMSPRLQACVRTISNLASLSFFLVASYAAYIRTVEDIEDGSALSGIVSWLTWPCSAIVMFGSLLLAVRLALATAQDLSLLSRPSHGNPGASGVSASPTADKNKECLP